MAYSTVGFYHLSQTSGPQCTWCDPLYYGNDGAGYPRCQDSGQYMLENPGASGFQAWACELHYGNPQLVVIDPDDPDGDAIPIITPG
jgi:hypothetical protein